MSDMSGTPDEVAAAATVGALDAWLPVGAILAYAGEVPGVLEPEGWLECDGRVVDRNEFPELWATISFNFGKVDDSRLYLPDLRGLFVRGTCHDGTVRAERDPDWQDRTSLRPGGNFRERVGSYEPYGTAKPREPFQAEIRFLNIKDRHDDAGCATRPGRYTDDSKSVEVSSGGDKETRPVNKYVYFMVKASATTRAGTPTLTPVGAVVPYAGPRGDAKSNLGGWTVCTSRAVPTIGAYRELFDVIGFGHGRQGEDMVLPDYRGWFLRGVSGMSRRDPESEQRREPYEHGNHGDLVGSKQGWATGIPFRPFSTTFSHLPREEASKRVAGFAWDLFKVNGGGVAVSYSGSGGDVETRPRNVSVDWYIRYESAPADAPGDGFPVGAVAAVGWDLPPNEHWLPCDGRQDLRRDAYPELYQAIGNVYGGQADGETFGLPDYRGRFLRGVDDGAGVDPDAARRAAAPGGQADGVGSVQDYATAPPHDPFGATVPGLPTDTLGAHGATNGGNAGADGNLTIDPWSTGGDGDTRPANVYLNFCIRAR